MDVSARGASIPAGWPLDAEGRITCATCHAGCGRVGVPGGGDGGGDGSGDTYGGAHGDAYGGAKPASRLRGGLSGWEFCASCHGGVGSTAAGAGPSVRSVLLASVGGPPTGGLPTARQGAAMQHARNFAIAHPSTSVPAETSGELDGASRRCLFCHDGTVGASGDFSLERAPGIGERRSSHPIGTAYPPRPNPYSDNAYVPLGSLDRRILLPDGRVGCVSCHDLFASVEKLLVMPNHESRLCYACHDL